MHLPIGLSRLRSEGGKGKLPEKTGAFCRVSQGKQGGQTKAEGDSGKETREERPNPMAFHFDDALKSSKILKRNLSRILWETAWPYFIPSPLEGILGEVQWRKVGDSNADSEPDTDTKAAVLEALFRFL